MYARTIVLALILTGTVILSGCKRAEPSAIEVEFTALTQSFVNAAARKDTAAIKELAVSSSALLRRLEHWWSDEPALLSAADGKLRAEAAVMIGTDTLYGEVAFPYRGKTEVFAAGYVRSGSSWRLYYIGLPARL